MHKAGAGTWDRAEDKRSQIRLVLLHSRPATPRATAGHLSLDPAGGGFQ